jgi:3-dehydroquinate dehydratase type I
MQGKNHPRICISIMARSTQEALIKMKEGLALVDLLELRIDTMQRVQLKKLLARNEEGLLVTNRKKAEGGNFSGEEKERVSFLMEAVELGAGYVDLEIGTDKALIAALQKKIQACEDRSKLILSYHHLDGTPSVKDLRKELEEGYRAGADIVKIVPRAKKIEDNLSVLSLLPFARRSQKEIIAFCMGERGRISRVMAPLMGSYLTYASLTKGEESAPGQMTVKELNQIFKILNKE